MEQQGVDQCVGGVVCIGVDYQVDWFVDDEYVFVFVQDFQWDVFWFGMGLGVEYDKQVGDFVVVYWVVWVGWFVVQ